MRPISFCCGSSACPTICGNMGSSTVLALLASSADVFIGLAHVCLIYAAGRKIYDRRSPLRTCGGTCSASEECCHLEAAYRERELARFDVCFSRRGNRL